MTHGESSVACQCHSCRASYRAGDFDMILGQGEHHFRSRKVDKGFRHVDRKSMFILGFGLPGADKKTTKNKKKLPVRESNSGLPRDKRAY